MGSSRGVLGVGSGFLMAEEVKSFFWEWLVWE